MLTQGYASLRPRLTSGRAIGPEVQSRSPTYYYYFSNLSHSSNFSHSIVPLFDHRCDAFFVEVVGDFFVLVGHEVFDGHGF